MGMYTKFEATIRIPIKEETHQLLNYFSTRLFEMPFSDHDFFGCSRYEWLLGSTSLITEDWGYYTEENSRILKVDVDMKNYNSEIEKFCDFISEYTDDEVIGFSMYEECEAYDYYLNKNIRPTGNIL